MHRIPQSPSLCLLGTLTEVENLPIKYRNPLLISRQENDLFKIGNLKHPGPNQWTNLLKEYIILEKNSYIYNNDISAFNNIWNPFASYFKLRPNAWI